jgi:DNA-binding XRE family transcriptional regulator
MKGSRRFVFPALVEVSPRPAMCISGCSGTEHPSIPEIRRSRMTKTIRQLRQERGESQHQLAEALGATLLEVQDLEAGIASPLVTRVRLLTEHFGVREEDIDLEPNRPPSLGEQVLDAITE